MSAGRAARRAATTSAPALGLPRNLVRTGLLLLLVVLVSATPWHSVSAVAHTNRSIVRLAVTSQTDVTVVHAFLVYADDREPITDEFVLADISGPWGRRTVQLEPDRSTAGHFAARLRLPPGNWTLRVDAKAATVGSATGVFTTAGDGQLRGMSFSAGFEPASLPPRATTPSRAASLAGPALACALALVLALMLFVAARLRRSRQGGA